MYREGGGNAFGGVIFSTTVDKLVKAVDKIRKAVDKFAKAVGKTRKTVDKLRQGGIPV